MWISPVLQEEWKKIKTYGFPLQKQADSSNMATEGDYTPQKKMLPVELIFVLYFQMVMLQSAGSSVRRQLGL